MSYTLCQMPGDTDGTYAVVRVLNQLPPYPPPPRPLRLDTPLHLCNQSKLITQHRLGDHGLPYRTIDPKLYDQCEIDWYGTGVH